MNFLFVTRGIEVMNYIRGGGCVRSTLLIEALSKLGHVDVISFVKEPVESTVPNCDVIFRGETPKGVLTLRDRVLLNLRLFFTPWSPKGYYSIDKEQEDIVSRFYNAKHYDYVVCRYIWEAVSCGLMRYEDHLIIDVDDNLVSALKRDLAKSSNYHIRARIKLLWKTLMIEKMQQHVLKRVKLSFYSNEREPPYKKSVYLYNVPLLSSPCSDVTRSTQMRLLFVGNLDLFPNRNGILHFVKTILPIIKERVPTVELDIVGLCKDPEIRLQLCSINGVNVCGFVNDLQEEYQNCRVVIVPIYHGSGTSIKFIEGVMMNRPVVATPVGARGFDGVFQSNKHFLLAKSDREFADCVVNVLSDMENANLMAREAYEMGKAHFSKSGFFSVVIGSINAITEHQSSLK